MDRDFDGRGISNADTALERARERGSANRRRHNDPRLKTILCPTSTPRCAKF